MFMENALRILPIIGIAMMAYIILSIGPAEVIQTFNRVDASYLVPAVLLFMVSMGIQNLKWEYMIKKQGINLGFWTLFRIYFIGTFYGIITPGRVGNFIRIGYIKKRTSKSTGECAVSIVLDKVLEFAALSMLAAAGIIMMANYISFEIFVAITLLLIAFFSATFLLLRKGSSMSVLKIFWRLFVPGSMKARAKDAFNSFYENILDWKDMMIPLSLTLIGWVILYTSTYMIALSLGMVIPQYIFIAIMPIATLIGILPVTVGGWGTREATLILLFSVFGIGSEATVVMSIIAAVMSYVITTAFGVYFVYSEGRIGHNEEATSRQ
ncbi:MAG: flippase-like domain-containing protein [Candidatus Aenigmarchaeota archaeon]|nr:flippase-like domain-containing protein [Candidatus Aenigmarchaeota archaeon]